MVAKISIGSSLYGALAYNGEKMNEAHGRVLGANKIVLPADGNINISAMAENFKAFMPKMGKTKKPVLHISLNPHPNDRLTDQDYEILAREYLDKLGFGEQPYIIYKHTDIDRHHIHIVTVNVNEQGKRLDQSFLFRRSKKITNELEEKYGLHKAQREKVSPDTPITKIEPNGDIKRQVQNTVKLVGMRWQFQSIGEYNAILGLYNIRCELTDGKVNGREYHGLVYFATDDNGNTIAMPLKASRLGKFASRTALENKFERDKDKIDIKPTKRIVADTMASATCKDDFIAKLKEKNIDLVLRYNSDGRLYGATYVDHGNHVSLNGSRLGKEFSANALNQWFNDPAAKPLVQPQPNQSQGQQTTGRGNQQSPPPNGGQQTYGHSQPQPSSSQPQQRQSRSDDFDYSPVLPGLELFQTGPDFDPAEEAFARRARKKKKKKGRGL
jgi:hypothetical protein